MLKREFTDAQGVKWAVSLTAHTLRMAMRELGANLAVCLTERVEEFVLALAWYAVEDQARLNLVTRDQFERNHLTASDLFAGGKLMFLMDELISDALPKREEPANVGETPAPESL